MIYFSEDFGQVAGIHARDEQGNFHTILEGSEYLPGRYSDIVACSKFVIMQLEVPLNTSPSLFGTETTGITFSPDGKHMYFCFQDDGAMFDLTRDDGLSFHGKTVNLKPRHDENPARFRR